MVTQLTGNAWFYNEVTGVQGMLAISSTSDLVKRIGAQWFIELGQVADQSFGGGSYSSAFPLFKMGTGPYSPTYWNSTALNMTTPWGGKITMTDLSFGSISSWSSGIP